VNLELLEHELAQLDGKPVILCIPSYGKVSFAYSGILNVTRTTELLVAFHLITPMHEVAIIFSAEDVLRIDPPGTAEVQNVIRLRGPHDYREHFAEA
jgi:hypothetical protein